jgi:anti-repressor protein
MARALIVAQEALQRRDAVIAEQAAAIEERDRSIALQDAVITRTEKQVEAMAPKALFADAVASSDRCVLVRDLAKIVRQNGVEVGEKRLFVWLRDKGYLIKSGSSWNMPTQRSMEMGLFCVKETAITHSDGHVTINRTPMVTGKGQVYFVAKLCGRDSPRQLAIDGVTS